MTEAHRLAIESACARLVALYANLSDAARWEDVVALFAEGGRLARPTAPEDWIVGHDALLGHFQARPPRPARHLCANVVVTVLGEDRAEGECALALFMPDTAPKAGSFHDSFVRTADGWRFAERRGSLAFP